MRQSNTCLGDSVSSVAANNWLAYSNTRFLLAASESSRMQSGERISESFMIKNRWTESHVLVYGFATLLAAMVICEFFLVALELAFELVCERIYRRVHV